MIPSTQNHLRFLVISALFLASAPSRGQDTIYLEATANEDLKAKEGQKVVVHGVIEGSGKSASGTNFVNFKGAEFFLVTFKSDLGPFADGEPADLYEGKRIAVEGPISIYQGKPQIKLTDPAQVTILAPDAVFPPPQEKKEASAAPAKAMPEQTAAANKPVPGEPKRKPPVDPSEYFKNSPAPDAGTNSRGTKN